MTEEFHSQNRFTDRVDDYVRFRPSYPVEVFAILRRELHLPSGSAVADIGSGTGIFTELLLQQGYEVWGIEPNAAMRAAALQQMFDRPRFHSVPGTAEETQLPDGSVDLVTAAQAFHWFDIEQSRREFSRILRRPKNVLLIWNDRQEDSTPFLRDYEDFLQRFGTDYLQIQQRHLVQMQSIPSIFAVGSYRKIVLENSQKLDLREFIGRVLSSSYVPQTTHPAHQQVLRDLKRIFDKHEQNGTVEFRYDVCMHLGHMP